jgi:hypothetical protein
MVEISKIAVHFNGVECPVCKDHQLLSPILRCDLLEKECVAVACCERCHSIFSIEASQLSDAPSAEGYEVSCSAESGVCVIKAA